ncbi:MAG TPA: NAD-dependent DNA ligase LigA [Candidatus Woesebacteria bacterium]|nr:NAD-dependent DNA ligase LigA [Candidatus Woesebacteria bacterium]HOG37610.1 NAD-dependent DNA ligase LigA [Candidatus Woesebacteria bacterium]
MITLDSAELKNISPESLGELLIEAKKAYYTGGKPIMDDHTYDVLENTLHRQNPYHRIFSKVGTDDFNTGFDKKSHFLPMGSQNKVNTYADLVHYFQLKKIPQNSKFLVQVKCDGISLEIEYNQGQLVDAITRGNGLIGDIITQNVVKMKNFVPRLPQKFSGSIRCEILVTKKDFIKLNKIVEKQVLPPLSKGGDIVTTISEGFYSNPRNAASGLSQRLDGLNSHLCSLYATDISGTFATESEKIDLLKTLGFTPVESHLCHTFEAIEKIYQNFLHRDRESYPYDIDGLVIKINDLKIAKKLGQKNGRPKYQVAYKFPADSNQSQIKNITWQVGPLGSVTPVAEIEPIEISGAVINFASLGNYDLVAKKNLNLGDIIEISRRGDVIPHIEKVITKVNPGTASIPTHCPACKTVLIKENKSLRCPNSLKCLPQILGSLKLFCDKLQILGLSDKTIKKLYHSDKLKLPGDFYRLTLNDIQDLENLGEKSAKNILRQIDLKKHLTLKEIFDAASIPNFSAARIQQLIIAGFDTPKKLLNLNLADFLAIKGFKTTLAQKILNGLNQRRDWIESILNQVTLKNNSAPKTKLSGLSFAITGTLSLPRKQLEEKIISLGGKVSNTVTSHTNYLITNEISSTSDKFISAKKIGTKIITESDFHQLAD